MKPEDNVEVDKLADAIVRKMKEDKHVFWVDPEQHAQDHELVEEIRKEREEAAAEATIKEGEKREMVKKVKYQIVGLSVTALGGGFLFSVGYVGHLVYMDWVDKLKTFLKVLLNINGGN